MANAFENTKDTVNELLGWDDEISNDGFKLIPDGDYNFTVVNFQRDRFSGNDKTPECNKAIITLRVNYEGENADIKHTFFMLRKNEWQLSQFFTSIGQKKHGEPLKMNWSRVIGSSGRCRIGKRTYNGNEYNEVKKFYEPQPEDKDAFNGGF